MSAAPDRLGHGRALPASVRTNVEDELGADLSGVRVHTGNDVDRQADALDADAFTHRDEIYIAGGAIEPGHAPRAETLAHELTHVVQQRGGSARVRRSAQPGVVQRQPKGHELQKTPAFRDAAKKYEHNLGFYAYNHDQAAAGAMVMIEALRERVYDMYE